jgi:hypothetical protein
MSVLLYLQNTNLFCVRQTISRDLSDVFFVLTFCLFDEFVMDTKKIRKKLPEFLFF